LKNYNLTTKYAISLKDVNKTFYSFDKGAPFLSKIKNLFFSSNQRKNIVLKDININVRKGEFIGIIGKNGTGKSTLLKIIIGAISADKGSIIETNGKVIRLALGIGFDANLSARDNIYLNGSIIGLTLKQIGEKLEEIIEFAELENYIDTPVRFYSSGMKSRLSFSIALHANADILLIDEFFGAVGDENFKQKSQKAFEENILKGKTIIHVSHSMANIKKHCDRVIVLKKNENKVFENPKLAIAYYLDKSP